MIPRTLRARFILSHVLPLLVVIPLMGLTLIYVLEMRVVLPNLVDELKGQATLLAEIARGQPAIWRDSAEADVFVTRFGRELDGRLTLISIDGRILASTNPLDAARLGQRLVHPGFAAAASGAVDVRTQHRRHPEAEVVDVLEPVPGQNGTTAGIIRVTLLAGSVIQELFYRRYLIAGILAAGVLVGSAIGWILALNLSQPLQQVTQSVQELAEGQTWTTLPDSRVDEIGRLVGAFNNLVERLRSLEDARKRLLANLVHEIGRPLGALHAAVQALQGGADTDAGLRRELLSGIHDEIGRLRRLLDDLAGVRDRLLGPLELDRRAVPIGEWLPHVLTPWREAALRKGLRWNASVSAELPVAQIDPDRLGQAVGNLISNAVKFTPVGGSVSVTTGVEDGMLWIRVADSGPGISPNERERIFQPLYRTPGDRRFPQGMGLGLAIARDLIVAHVGSLDVESDGGTRFTVRLPLRT